MSEPSSLYLRVTLTQQAFEAFQNSALTPPHHYNDWQPWLATKRYHGSISDADIAAMTHEYPNAPQTVGAYFKDGWGLSSRYDPATHRWTLGMIECSENFKDFILILSILRRVQDYKDLPGMDFLLIYPYIWGGAPEAYMLIEQGASRFVADVPQDVFDEAGTYFQSMYPPEQDFSEL